jgi:hypothetical protein
MTSIRRALVAALAVVAVLALGAPAASAQAVPPIGGISPPQWYGPWGTAPAGPCAVPSVQGQGSTGRISTQVCQGVGGPTFVGPQIGQVASVIGPVIIGPTAIETINVSGGNSSG